MLTTGFQLGVVVETDGLCARHIIIEIFAPGTVVALNLSLAAMQTDRVTNRINALMMRLKVVALFCVRKSRDGVEMMANDGYDAVANLVIPLVYCGCIPDGIQESLVQKSLEPTNTWV